MKKIIISVFCALIASSLFGCTDYDNDDFAPYERYSKPIDAFIPIEMGSLSDIVPDINKIAQEQQSNLVLTSVEMTFEGRDDCERAAGTIIFGYTRPHAEINQVSKMDIYYNSKSRMVEKFDWEKGHGKRVTSPSAEISDKYINLPLPEIMAHFNQNSEYLSKMRTINPKLIIELSFSQLRAYLYDLNPAQSSPVFRYDSSKDEPE
ncbi:MAG: hypothetical protein LBK28_06865 [Propionibacteriaceae bacterium]|nr:hypothetical protein [Propionibacteriaceae bacterium]